MDSYASLLKMVKDWYLGLDIGTNSVGFSVTDIEYNILTKNGKLQCGARLFEAAQDASARRSFRSSRRRFARRKVRIDLLQELFNLEIAKKDQAFFIRLNESSLYLEDKTQNCKYPLFNDKDFTNKGYYKKFPTIYYLRKHLLENEENDVRLLYLACHHLIKYREHFLSPNINTNPNNRGYLEKITEINNQLSNVCFNTDMIEDILCIIKNKDISAARQWFEIKQKFNPTDKLYLYFTQLGQCMYSGEKIALSDLNKDNLYDIDHIYRQSKIKDDNLTNCVLVKRNHNADKTNEYLIAPNIQSKMKSFWALLKKRELINNNKYDCLTCTRLLYLFKWLFYVF